MNIAFKLTGTTVGGLGGFLIGGVCIHAIWAEWWHARRVNASMPTNFIYISSALVSGTMGAIVGYYLIKTLNSN